MRRRWWLLCSVSSASRPARPRLRTILPRRLIAAGPAHQGTGTPLDLTSSGQNRLRFDNEVGNGHTGPLELLAPGRRTATATDRGAGREAGLPARLPGQRW